MTRQVSFSKIRNDMMHGFRKKMHTSESTEDVKKFYTNTMQAMFNKLVGRDDPVRFEDITLVPSKSCGYEFSKELLDRPLFQSAWNESDLPMIVDDYTKIALNRYTHLQRNPDKTRAKIHHTDGKR